MKILSSYENMRFFITLPKKLSNLISQLKNIENGNQHTKTDNGIHLSFISTDFCIFAASNSFHV